MRAKINVLLNVIINFMTFPRIENKIHIGLNRRRYSHAAYTKFANGFFH